MNIENLFDYCTDEIQSANEDKVTFVVDDSIPFGNSLYTIAINNSNNKIYAYSNEWLYLIKVYYHHNRFAYQTIIDKYKMIILNNQKNSDYINEIVIPFITSFSRGTVHGYSGIFYILNEYINNLDAYKNYKILVYKDSQKGILDIIHYLINKNIISKEKIIYISSKIEYLFKSIRFIPNNWHIYPTQSDFKLDIIDRYFIDNKYLNYNYKKIIILKSSKSENITNFGIFNIIDIDNFSRKFNVNFLEPTSVNEIELINSIYNCEIFIVSWGTTFFKNYVYISNKCKKIIVLIYGNEFIAQYTNHNKNSNFLQNYRNIPIEYFIVNNKLTTFTNENKQLINFADEINI